MMTLPPRQSSSGRSVEIFQAFQIGGIHRLRDVLVAAEHEAAALQRDVLQCSIARCRGSRRSARDRVRCPCDTSPCGRAACSSPSRSDRRSCRVRCRRRAACCRPPRPRSVAPRRSASVCGACPAVARRGRNRGACSRACRRSPGRARSRRWRGRRPILAQHGPMHRSQRLAPRRRSRCSARRCAVRRPSGCRRRCRNSSRADSRVRTPPGRAPIAPRSRLPPASGGRLSQSSRPAP